MHGCQLDYLREMITIRCQNLIMTSKYTGPTPGETVAASMSRDGYLIIVMANPIVTVPLAQP